MNFLQLIQAIAGIKTGEQPSTFAITADEDYLKIKEEINNALRDFYLGYEWQFRNKSTTFNTVANQQSYPITWNGSIKDDGVLYPDDDGNLSELAYNPNYNSFIKQASYGTPTEYTIYGSSILLNPIPQEIKAVTINYINDNWAKSVGVVDQSSASGQAKLYITSTEGFTAGSTVIIEPDTPREETVIIDSVTTNDYLTMTTNLAYTHAVNSTAEYHKTTLDYQLDQPNFDAKWHYIVVYGALDRLFYNDPIRKGEYIKRYADLYSTIVKESEKSYEADNRLHFITTDWI